MKRRDFFAASAAAGFGLGLGSLARAAERQGKDLLELRRYTFANEGRRREFDEYLAKAAVPALNRAGVKPVGAFILHAEDNPKMEIENPTMYVLLPHKSCESVLTLVDRLSVDGEFTTAAWEVHEAPKDNPVYLRFESSLMISFDKAPHVEVPTEAPSRVLQLRIYESHSIERALMKIQMFNEGGEIDIFREVGMDPVFFGQSVIGQRLPNLTYMLSFENEEAQQKAWKAFLAAPAWNELKVQEQYKDTVSNITNLILKPAVSSQI